MFPDHKHPSDPLKEGKVFWSNSCLIRGPSTYNHRVSYGGAQGAPLYLLLGIMETLLSSIRLEPVERLLCPTGEKMEAVEARVGLVQV